VLSGLFTGGQRHLTKKQQEELVQQTENPKCTNTAFGKSQSKGGMTYVANHFNRTARLMMWNVPTMKL